MRRWLTVIVVLALLSIAHPAYAHANLARSNPSANAVLEESPAEIRLWFTEPLEPSFSRFTLRDAAGTIIETPLSQIDSDDAMQMFLQPGVLPDGLYTVVWENVSASDGHHSEGSFPFTIGEPITTIIAASETAQPFPVEGTVVRWLNLLSMSMLVGGVGFWLFVWTPSVPDSQADVERLMRRVVWIGWVLVGVAGAFILVLQTSQAAGVSLWEALTDHALGQVISMTRFGQIWLARMGLWLGFEFGFLSARKSRRALWVSLIVGFALLLTISIYSHASAAPDAFAAVFNDCLHLTAAALWIGGLLQFIVVIGVVRKHFADAATIVSTLVGYFSNFARLCVVMLILTGFYTAWLHVGSIEALFATQYGQALVIKLILFLPLLLLAGINLVFTARALQNGQSVWISRLRGLVGAEIALTMGVLLAAGAMTSVQPARADLGQRVVPPLREPIFLTQMSPDMHIDLEVSSSWVGDNTFTVMMYSMTNGAPIEDASLIRLRFTNPSQYRGESELRPEHQGDGLYSVSGSNLSVPGTWQVRMTIQRPEQFDLVLDFELEITVPPPPAPAFNMTLDMDQRGLMLALVGLAALGFGSFGLTQKEFQLSSGSGILSVGLLLMGIVFFASIRNVPSQPSVLDTNEIYVSQLWATEAANMSLTIENPGAQSIVLTRVSSAHIEFAAIDRIEIPARTESTVTLQGEGENLPDAISLMLTFERGDEIIEIVTAAAVQDSAPPVSDFLIVQSWARPTATAAMTTEGVVMGANTGSVYMDIINRGVVSDRLVGAETDAARVVELHETQIANDVMRMRPLLDGLEIPAGERLSIAPSRYHLMLIDLTRDLISGDAITLTLTFESGRTVMLGVPIYDAR